MLLLTLHLLLAQEDRLQGKCVYFVRLNPKGVSERAVDTDMITGEIAGNALDLFKSMVADLYVPILEDQTAWGKQSQENTKEFLTTAHKFGDLLVQAVSSLEGALELERPEPQYVKGDAKPSLFLAVRIAAVPSAATAWCCCHQVSTQSVLLEPAPELFVCKY